MPAPLITIAEARERVLSAAAPLGTERVAIDDAPRSGAGRRPDRRRRRAAVPVLGDGRLRDPPRRRRPHADRRRRVPRRDPLVAARSATASAIRISTGGAIPDGATAVIPQEDVETRDGTIIDPDARSSAGDHIRGAGEDMRSRRDRARAGTTLGAAELGAAVAAGVAELTVYRAPQGPGAVHRRRAPRPGRAARPGRDPQLERADARRARRPRRARSPGPRGGCPTTAAATEAGLATALDSADVVIVSGGVSVGPHDHVKPALAALGVEEVFWRVALQPGKPTWFGRRGVGARVRAAGQSGLGRRHVLAVRAPGARRAPGPERGAELEPEAVLATAVRRNPDREQAVRVRLERRERRARRHAQRAAGVAHRDLAARRGRARVVPAGEGELEAGAAVALERLPR